MTSALTLFVQAMFARSYARVIWMFRNRTWIFQETLLPILSVAAFAYAYEALGAPRQFIGYVILGAAMTAFWFNVLWSMGAHLYWERDSGNLELYILSPAPMMGILAGMALGGMATTLTRATAILVTGVLIFRVPIDLSNGWLALGTFLLTLLALYGLGMMFASLFLLWGREAWHMVNLLQEPVFLLTGMNFPIRIFLGYPLLLGVALLIPLTAGMDAMRQLLFPIDPTTGTPRQGLRPVEEEILILTVLAVVFLVLARRCLRVLERKAKEEGRLSIRWQ
ncbi:MAG: ABC transporter permease [Gemmataceae bacterium]